MSVIMQSLKAIVALFIAPLAAWLAIRFGWTPDETNSFTENLGIIIGWIFSIGLPTAIGVWLTPTLGHKADEQQSKDGGANA